MQRISRYIFTLVVSSVFIAEMRADNTAPTIAPSADQTVIADQKETVDLTASGGTCPKPDGDCGWEPAADPTYVWTYEGLNGTPASGSEGATLKLNRDQGGSANVTVKKKQTWKDRNGKAAPNPTFSQDSNPVKVKVQIPTSITFVSSALNADGSGGAYKFTVLDQDSEPIKNAKLTLHETFGGTSATYNLSTNALLYQGPVNQDPSHDVASDKGTDGDGNIVDTPVGEQVVSVVADSKKWACDVKEVEIITHNYTNITTPDGSAYKINYQQPQTIVQKGLYNNGSPTAQSVSASPEN